jgi:hypothetical protein
LLWNILKSFFEHIWNINIMFWIIYSPFFKSILIESIYFLKIISIQFNLLHLTISNWLCCISTNILIAWVSIYFCYAHCDNHVLTIYVNLSFELMTKDGARKNNASKMESWHDMPQTHSQCEWEVLLECQGRTPMILKHIFTLRIRTNVV